MHPAPTIPVLARSSVLREARRTFPLASGAHLFVLVRLFIGSLHPASRIVASLGSFFISSLILIVVQFAAATTVHAIPFQG
jgi:hypothetical protein